jgi:hypothetical protein
MSDRPLFVPLKGEFYDAFADGTKIVEYRRYGPRWNERTCPVGRRVVLSRGYGRRHRLSGQVGGFGKRRARDCAPSVRVSLEQLYGSLDIDIACIWVVVDKQAVAEGRAPHVARRADERSRRRKAKR